MPVKLTLPNLLSASRIIFLPLLYLLLYFGLNQVFLIVYIIVGSTDFFDGIVARKLNQVSHFGKELDSLADLFFYISSAYFLYLLQPEAVAANTIYLVVFFSLLGFSFILSGILFRKPVMMHTMILRKNAVMVLFILVASFWIDTTLLVRLVVIIYIIGFIEEILIFIFFGNVDPDTKSIFHLLGSKSRISK
ncbi:MAG: CDP-alcohol phosphatidyltransferase family protein [Bacillota bacterium]